MLTNSPILENDKGNVVTIAIIVGEIGIKCSSFHLSTQWCIEFSLHIVKDRVTAEKCAE